ncbi:hypothetical protein HY025_01015 [Candidatus Daviesbacteria bacterium]|nr:hypothetical protein [Candidatus Daviesbacteria bacterium]
MKTLVTHINPHLDDIVGIWLVKKFMPDFEDSKIEFISAEQGKSGLSDSDDKLFIGVGMGKFDEHKGDLDESAGSLVWKYLKQNSFAPSDEISQKALAELSEWNRLIDTGKAPITEFSEFSVQSFIRSQDSQDVSSLKSTELGLEILDRIFAILKAQQQALKDWEKRQEFETKFGKTIAVKSSAVDRAFCKREGSANLYLIFDPKNTSVQFFTPSFDRDLEPIYIKVKSLDKEANWFLHQSHHMVICGSSSAPESKKTKLSFEQLIEIAKTI